jgi:hypothetical protein
VASSSTTGMQTIRRSRVVRSMRCWTTSRSEMQWENLTELISYIFLWSKRLETLLIQETWMLAVCRRPWMLAVCRRRASLPLPADGFVTVNKQYPTFVMILDR